MVVKIVLNWTCDTKAEKNELRFIHGFSLKWPPLPRMVFCDYYYWRQIITVYFSLQTDFN